MIDVALDALVEAPHAIDVHVVDEATDTRVRLACGTVGGVPADDDLVFGLADAGAAEACTTGVAWLHALDGTTRVTLFVSQGLCPDRGAEATPAP